MQPNNHNTQMAREKNVLTSPFMTFGGRNLFGVTKRVSRKNIEALDFAFASKPKRPPISPKPHTRAQILFSVSHAKRMCSLTYKEMNQNSTSEVRTSKPNELKRRCLNLIQDSSPPSEMNEYLHHQVEKRSARVLSDRQRQMHMQKEADKELTSVVVRNLFFVHCS